MNFSSSPVVAHPHPQIIPPLIVSHNFNNFNTNRTTPHPIIKDKRAGLFNSNNNNNKKSYFSKSICNLNSLEDNIKSTSNSTSSESGGEDFLINKSRVPDILLINRYYGLVNKKFVINSRYQNSDFSSKLKSTKPMKIRPKTCISSSSYSSSSFDNNNKIEIEEKKISRLKNINSVNPSSNNNNNKLYCPNPNENEKEEEFNNINNNNNEDLGFMESLDNLNLEESQNRERRNSVEVVARKIPFEKYKKWRKFSKDGFLVNSEANFNSSSETAAFEAKKNTRVIKIDLNNLNWEESLQNSHLDNDNDNEYDNLEDENYNRNGNYENEKLEKKNGRNGFSRKRGLLKKSASVDDHLLYNNNNNNNDTNNNNLNTNKSSNSNTIPQAIKPEKPILKQRPSTSVAASPVNSNSNPDVLQTTGPPPPSSETTKILPWTSKVGQTTAERRSKFQKSSLVYSSNNCNQIAIEPSSPSVINSSININEGSGCESESSSIWASCERKDSLFVQDQFTEISTMVSLISPPPDEELQNEIDKVAIILSKNSSQMKISPEKNNNEASISNISNDDISIEKEFFKSEGERLGGSSHHRRKPLFKKSLSFSCENELIPPPPPIYENENNVKGSQHQRPKTSKALPRLLRSSSVSHDIQSRSIKGNRPLTGVLKNYIPSQLIYHKNVEIKQNHQSSLENGNGTENNNNKKIVIKKALIEINQSSTSPATTTFSNNFGKKPAFGRPKTAPIPDKKSSSSNSTANNTTTSTITNNGRIKESNSTKTFPINQSQRRQPFKVLVSKDSKKKNHSSGKEMEEGLIGSDSYSSSNTNKPLLKKIKSEDERERSETIIENGNDHEKTSTSKVAATAAEIWRKKRFGTRRSISFDDGLILGFSQQPHLFQQQQQIEDNDSNSKDNNEIVKNYLNSKKREDCLKVYEKMMKTGLNVKMETIFRGMMTPLEYKEFIKATESVGIGVLERKLENVNLNNKVIIEKNEDENETSSPS